MALGLAIIAVAAMVLWAGTQAPAGAQSAASQSVSEGPGTPSSPVATPAVAPPPTPASLPGETAPGPAPAATSEPAASGQAGPGLPEQEAGAKDQPVYEPVALGSSVAVERDVTASISAVSAVSAVGQGVGEISGPAVSFSVTIHNGTDKPLNTSGLTVNVDSSDARNPAIQVTGAQAAQFPGAIDPAASAEATYVFVVPVEDRDVTRIFVSYSATSPIAAFEGPAPKAEGKP